MNLESPTEPVDPVVVLGSRPRDADVFLAFYYPELKDLGKHFLTVVSGVLAFFVAFADKLLDVAKATAAQRAFLIAALALLIVSVGCVGTGIYINFVAGGRANGSIIRGKSGDFKPLVRRTYALYHTGGAAFVLALCLVAGLAILKVI
ncbi:MAG: hypothetical protein ACXW4P_04070 [Thermoanaerobaculia bacterium]